MPFKGMTVDLWKLCKKYMAEVKSQSGTTPVLSKDPKDLVVSESLKLTLSGDNFSSL